MKKMGCSKQIIRSIKIMLGRINGCAIISILIFCIIIVTFLFHMTKTTEHQSYRGNTLLLDVQTVESIESPMTGNFTPLCVGTIVFAIDRDITEYTPSTWRDLEKSPVSIGFSDDDPDNRAIIASLAYALEGKDYKKHLSINFLKELRNKKKLYIGNRFQPITICFDYDAIQRIKDGENLDIVVPSDGTLSFTIGSCGKRIKNRFSNRRLVEMGYRLPNGQCDRELYPSEDKYRSATRLRDYERFHRATSMANNDIRRTITRERLFSPADSRENIMVVVTTSMLILLWAVGAVYRSPQRDIKRYTFTISFAVIIWLYISLIKYNCKSQVLSGYLWYIYYIFDLGLPLSLLYVVTIFDQKKQRPPAWVYPFIYLYPIFLTFVLTNDFTELVFKFPNKESRLDEYNYTFLYYIIFTYCFVMLFLALGILIKKSCSSPKKLAPLFPIAVTIIIFVYNIGYIVGYPLLRNTNFVLMYSIQVILFLEALLSSHMIPTNTNYHEILSLSSLNMKVIDKKGRPLELNGKTSKIDYDIVTMVMKNPETSFSKDLNTLIHSKEIPGGYVIWDEDLSLIRKTNDIIEDNIRNIENANILLRREQNIRKKKISAEIKEDIFNRLEKDIDEKLNLLASSTKELSSCESRQDGFAFITLLLCYIKRYCNLFFCAEEADIIPFYEFNVYLDELSEFARYNEINSLVRTDISEDLELKTAMLLYEFYFIVLSWAIKKKDVTLICLLTKNEEGYYFTIISSCKVDRLRFTKTFLKYLDNPSVTLEFSQQEDSDSITLHIGCLGLNNQ